MNTATSFATSERPLGTDRGGCSASQQDLEAQRRKATPPGKYDAILVEQRPELDQLVNVYTGSLDAVYLFQLCYQLANIGDLLATGEWTPVGRSDAHVTVELSCLDPTEQAIVAVWLRDWEAVRVDPLFDQLINGRHHPGQLPSTSASD